MSQQLVSLDVLPLVMSKMACNGSEQLEKALDEVLDDENNDDEDQVKEEKSNVEKMEKEKDLKSQVQEPSPTGTPHHYTLYYIILRLLHWSFKVQV